MQRTWANHPHFDGVPVLKDISHEIDEYKNVTFLRISKEKWQLHMSLHISENQAVSECTHIFVHIFLKFLSFNFQYGKYHHI